MNSHALRRAYLNSLIRKACRCGACQRNRVALAAITDQPAGGLPAEHPRNEFAIMNVNDLKMNDTVYFWPNPPTTRPLEDIPAAARVTGIKSHSNGLDWLISLDHGCWERKLSELYPTLAHVRLQRIQELVAFGNQIFNVANRLSLQDIPAEYELTVIKKTAPADLVPAATVPMLKAA